MTAAGARSRWLLVAGPAAGVVAVDQLTKTWALRALGDGPIDLVWTLRLRLVFNKGAAFGLGGGNAAFFVVAAAVLVVVLATMARGLPGRPAAVALGLVLGGAVGNLVDRVVRDADGAVVDFVDLQWWPVFNLADSAIVVGAVLLVLTGGWGADDNRPLGSAAR